MSNSKLAPRAAAALAVFAFALTPAAAQSIRE
jgi:hypothetical protein